ncbi:MAG: hypothetical protein QOE68_129 [Thermoanaerobaculia bacterium]|jgi:hypothetical protein|nr:hypothetical protein [Thermoanaerobaculia bacterium]
MTRTRLLIGALLGALTVFAVAPYCIGWFSVPGGGIGAVTVAKYPKGFDYFVVIALTLVSAVGALAFARRRIAVMDGRPNRLAIWITAAVVFITMFVIHDHPYAFMDMFHEGEHLAPASVMLDGGRPYRDIFFLHGFAADGGLDALVLGGKPSPKKTRRVEAVLDAAALAMLVPIAAAVTTTTGGFIAAVILALCAVGAGEVPVFPYFRWLPLLIAVWALLDGAPRRWTIYLAAIASSLGILWSLDVGVCAVAATAIVILIYTRRVTLIAIAAIAAPLIVLLIARADLQHFFRDSFVIIPRSIDAIWSLPAKPLPSLSLLVHPVALWDWLASESARYYLPPVFFGFLLALAIRTRDMRVAIIAIFSIILFRTAAGRCSWSHTRFALPLLGLGVVAFLFEPMLRRPLKAWRTIAFVIAAILCFRYFEVAGNLNLGAKLLAGWPARQRHERLVPYSMARGRGIYTYPENAADLAALDDLARRAGPGPIFDLSGERALYYFLDRRPSTRCPDIAMLSNPGLSAEALRELNAHPPVFVILEGTKILGSLDGIANRDRVPPIAAWIDARYPVRMSAGRFVVGVRRK